MKKILLVVLVLLGCFSFSSFGQQGLEEKIVLYYFHGNARCISCRNIEKYTREALEKNFFDEIASGSIDFQVVNVEEKGNEHYTQDYKLYTKAVVLSRVKSGQEVEYKNLEQVWQYLYSREKFSQYIKDETQRFLEEEKGKQI
ncbi:MAG: hypothetical protein KKF78_02445 [Candidatus Omnitrophica bacterium]|nr:hypothetical protein [Candidatus Omnitrophota bacterium]